MTAPPPRPRPAAAVDLDEMERAAADESTSFVEVPVPLVVAGPTPELFAAIVQQIPPGYALVPAGYELRLAPPVRTRPAGAPGTGRAAGSTATARAAGSTGTARPVGSKPAPASTALTFPPAARLWGALLTTVGVLLLVVTADLLLFGHLKHLRDQRVAFDELRSDLANGTAPVNQTTDDGKLLPLGKPLGIIDFPALDLHEVFLEGTTSGVLESGVGHRRDTVMPGQLGTSVLMGRRTAFGGPFSALTELPLGVGLTVTDGLGEKLPFRVVAVRFGGDPVPAPPATGARITFVTATGGAYQPQGGVRVDADLVAGATTRSGAPVQAAAAGARPLTSTILPDSEKPMGGSTRAWPRIALGLMIMMPLSAGATWARYRWGRWQTWLAAMPPLLAAALWTSDAVIQLLPNLL